MISTAGREMVNLALRTFTAFNYNNSLPFVCHPPAICYPFRHSLFDVIIFFLANAQGSTRVGNASLATPPFHTGWLVSAAVRLGEKGILREDFVAESFLGCICTDWYE